MIRKFTEFEKIQIENRFDSAYTLVKERTQNTGELLKINKAFREYAELTLSNNLEFRMIEKCPFNRTKYEIYRSKIEKFNHFLFFTIEEVELLHSLHSLKPNLDTENLIKIFQITLATLGVKSHWNTINSLD